MNSENKTQYLKIKEEIDLVIKNRKELAWAMALSHTTVALQDRLRNLDCFLRLRHETLLKEAAKL